MNRLTSPRRLGVTGCVLALLVAAACGSQVAPTAGPSGSAPSASGAASPAGGASPSPAGDPQDDAVCLAVAPRADVESVLGSTVTDIVAEGTDLTVALTCTFTTAGGTLLLTTAAGDAATGFQSDMDNAAAYGQSPTAVDGVGDQAFYASAAERFPEQLVFTKGPILVRLLNQTDTTVGEEALASLAATAAEAIRGEIPPAG